jgi:uncharacterized Fe-S cluster-containing radical SAM superfamily protein
MERSPVSLVALHAPKVPLLSLDTVWFQVAGTLCNLTCHHCFISCGPGNRSHEMMARAEVARYLEEVVDLGVKDLYFTGGEPFLNREILGILEDALRVAPTTVLTNATLIDDRRAGDLAAIARATRYSFEVRVSLDGLTPETNDPIRGEGTFRTTIRGAEALHRAGIEPILTVAQTWNDEEDTGLRERFHALLRSLGIARPRGEGPASLPSRTRGRPDARVRARGAAHPRARRGLRLLEPPVLDEPDGHEPRRLRLPDPDRRSGRTHGLHAPGNAAPVPARPRSLSHVLGHRRVLQELKEPWRRPHIPIS